MVEQIVFLIGRIIFGLVFLLFSVNHFMQVDNMEQYAASKGVPNPRIAVLGAGILLLIGALSISLWLFEWVGIIALALFFIGVTPIMHNFWAIQDEQQQMAEMTNFLKNLALLGSLLIFAVLTTVQDLSYTIG